MNNTTVEQLEISIEVLTFWVDDCVDRPEEAAWETKAFKKIRKLLVQANKFKERAIKQKSPLGVEGLLKRGCEAANVAYRNIEIVKLNWAQTDYENMKKEMK